LLETEFEVPLRFAAYSHSNVTNALFMLKAEKYNIFRELEMLENDWTRTSWQG